MNIQFQLLKKLPPEVEDTEDINWNNISKPYPSKRQIPEWLLQQQAEFDDGGKTIKKCQPFLDGVTSGYIITMPDDAVIRKTSKFDFEISGPGGAFLSAHGYAQYNASWFKDRIVVKFNNPWIIKTPESYSCYICHPNGKNIRPFYTIPAVIDTDIYSLTVAFPFVWMDYKIGVELEIPKGTPMAQIIPFKRDTWDMQIDEANLEDWKQHQATLNVDPNNYYLKNIKQKKEFR